MMQLCCTAIRFLSIAFIMEVESKNPGGFFFFSVIVSNCGHHCIKIKQTRWLLLLSSNLLAASQRKPSEKETAQSRERSYVVSQSHCQELLKTSRAHLGSPEPNRNHHRWQLLTAHGKAWLKSAAVHLQNSKTSLT